MTDPETFVIVGAGLAGAKTAQALRERGFAGRIVLIGAEEHRPYERPALSKAYLLGEDERETLSVHPADWYAEHQVELRLGQPATAVDRTAHHVLLADGVQVEYNKLLLATGASPRRLAIAGADAGGVFYLRTVEDSDALRQMFGDVSRLVVIGAGWIGLEVTAAARAAGAEVTVVESAALPLLRVLGPEAAQVFAQLHREHGVGFRFDATVAEIRVEGGVATGVVLGGGEVLPADAVLVAVGATPNIELATSAGLAVDDGILADAWLRTSDPDIVAVGDVANPLHPFYGRRVRVEHWATALKQPSVAAASMLSELQAGYEGGYDELPYFYTDQYDLGMEYVGYIPGHDGDAGYDEVVIRGDLEGRKFIAFWVKDDQLLAAMAVNVWDVIEPIKTLIRSRAHLNPTRLADPDVTLSLSALCG
jgi:3-phenylpropionate/trans-cinnamate dioxygenase ferredoxin reductase subunit